MYHLRLKGEHYQMGVKRGTIFQRGNISFPLHLDTFQLEHGKQSEKILRKFFPEVCEEIRGVSDTMVPIIYPSYHGCCVWGVVCIIWKIIFQLKSEDVPLLLTQRMAI